jgi:hypothetical protein
MAAYINGELGEALSTSCIVPQQLDISLNPNSSPNKNAPQNF